MSNGTAPSCPVSYSQMKGTTHRSKPALDIATIPPARDLPSVITAINAINNVVQHLTRGQPQINNIRFPAIQAEPDPVMPPAPQYARYTWYETNRSYTDGKVVNPDDESQYVKVKTIATISWDENVTGNRLRYKA